MTRVTTVSDGLAAVVGLPDQVAKRDAEAFEVALDASGEDLAGGGWCRIVTQLVIVTCGAYRLQADPQRQDSPPLAS